MALNDVAVTAANVRLSAGVQTVEATYGETVTAGQWVYRKASDSKWYLTQADGSAEESGDGVQWGWSYGGGAADEVGLVVIGGTVTVGGVVEAGKVYVLSDTKGVITLANDLASTWYSSVAAVGASTSTVELIVKASGYQVA